MFQRYKAELFAVLGNRCVCDGCPWHVGRCVVDTPEVLEVDHSHNNGYRLRRTRSGKKTTTSGLSAARCYLREVRSLPDTHGLVLRCANCHRWRTIMEKRANRIDDAPHKA